MWTLFLIVALTGTPDVAEMEGTKTFPTKAACEARAQFVQDIGEVPVSATVKLPIVLAFCAPTTRPSI